MWLLGTGETVAPRPIVLGASRGDPRVAPAYVLLGLLVVVPAAGIALVRGFDGLYGQDAYAYFDYATGPLRQALIDRTTWPAFFWPPGYPLLVALVSFALGRAPAAGQLVSLVMGALVPVLTALLAHELWPRQRGLALLAGVLVALGGQLWQSSIVVMADTTGLAMATLAAWACVRYNRVHAPSWLVLASAALAVAILSRWIYGLVALPFALYVLTGGPSLRHVVVAALVGLGLLGPVLGPPLVGLVRSPGADAAFAGNLQVYSWSPWNALQREFETPDGRLSYARPNGLYYALAPANAGLFGPLLAPWLAIGLVAGIVTWPRRVAVLIVGWAAVVYLFHAGAPWQNIRFTLAYVPPLAILAATGLTWVARRLGRRPAAFWLVVGVALMVIGGVRLLNDFVDRKQSDLAMVAWTESLVPPGARLLTFGPTLTFSHSSRIPTFDLYDVPVEELRRPAPTYLLVDVANLDQQWSTQRPGELYRTLRDGPGLVPLGTFGAFSLFRVESV